MENLEINKNDKNVTMICQNSDKFDISQIMIEKSIIKDSEGNSIFKINSYNSAEQFSCDISLNSLKKTEPEKNETIPKSNSEPISEPEANKTTNGNSFRIWLRSGSGLSGGAIAAIVISLVLAIVAVIIALIFLKKQNPSIKNNTMENSTIENINIKSIK